MAGKKWDVLIFFGWDQILCGDVKKIVVGSAENIGNSVWVEVVFPYDFGFHNVLVSHYYYLSNFTSINRSVVLLQFF